LEEFGKRIRAFRKALGYSQEELSFRSELDRSYIGGIERGERNITLIKITRLAKALGIKPSELLGDIQEPN
jgi:transcriptional regulator with XRE-family HTH domain